MSYNPSPVPQAPEDIPAYLRKEMWKISNEMRAIRDGVAEVYAAEPADKNDGRLVLADGTNWNPGSGRGFYRYDETSGIWRHQSGGTVTWDRKTGAYTMVSKDRIFGDTSGGAFTLTLPASPSEDDYVRVAAGDISTYALTIGRNGSTIEGSATDLVVDISYIEWLLLYNGTTWKVFG